MSDYGTLLKIIKQAAVEAVEAGAPVNICVGKVMSEKPLKIMINQKMILTKMQLILTRNVTDHEIEVNIGWETGQSLIGSTGGGGNDLTHTHAVDGKKKIKVLNHLKEGEKVLMIRQQGGQKFIVIDRVVS